MGDLQGRKPPDAWYILTHFWRGWDFTQVRTEQFPLRQMPVAAIDWISGGCSMAARATSAAQASRRCPLALRWPVYAGFVLAVVLFGVYRQTQFIYFQF